MKRTVVLPRHSLAMVIALTLCLLIATPVWASTLTFTPAQNYTVEQDPFSVTGADFNGDGNADLAVATQNSNTSGFDDVTVLLNKGNGTFGTAQEYEVGQFPNSVISADFNEDGKKDLAVANGCGSDVSVSHSCNGNVSVLSGNSDGTFGTAQFIAVGTGNQLQSVTSSDFDGDGNLDLAVAIRYKLDSDGNSIPPNEIAVLLGNGDGTFGVPAFFGADTGPYSVTPADLNDDGKVDLAVANADSNNVSVLLGNGDGTFGTAQNFDVGNAATYATVADFNEDGKKDLAVAAYLNGVPVLLGKGDGTFGAAQNAGFYRAFSVTSSDFDADGNIDLAASDVGSDRVSVSRGNGDGTFGVPQTFQVAPDVRSVIGTDFDGDQIADLAVANHSSSSVSVLLNTTTPGTTPDTTAPSVTLSTPSDGATYDLNQAITANYSCHDEAQGSGVASCQGTVPDGSPVDTATLGTKSFTVTTSDNAGNVSSVTHTYTVVGAGQCTITGNAKANTISGTSGADIICGGGGNDTIKGLGGNDVLRGDAGNDKLFGGAGDDVVNSKDGVNGNDSLDGGTGTDTKVTDATEKSIVGFP
jgi:hypothetical protein